MWKTKVAVLTAVLLACAIGAGYAARQSSSAAGIVGPGSTLEHLLAKLPFVDKVMCLGLPAEEQAFGSFDEDTLKQWISSLRYATNAQNLSVASGPDERLALRQKFVPSDDGSMRVVVSINLEGSRTYEVEQSVLFESDFQWGSEAESGKFGFGFAGGSAPTGGVMAKDGFSARLMWKGNGDGTANPGLYLYSSDRRQNLPYGDEYIFSEFSIPLGEWFTIKTRLTTNSEHKKSDGIIQVWVNEELMFERDHIQWQSAGGQPMINQVLYSSFHGGNTDQWSPEREVFAQFSDMCVYKDRHVEEDETSDSSKESSK